jgi:hypothetical protein
MAKYGNDRPHNFGKIRDLKSVFEFRINILFWFKLRTFPASPSPNLHHTCFTRITGISPPYLINALAEPIISKTSATGLGKE